MLLPLKRGGVSSPGGYTFFTASIDDLKVHVQNQLIGFASGRTADMSLSHFSEGWTWAVSVLERLGFDESSGPSAVMRYQLLKSLSERDADPQQLQAHSRTACRRAIAMVW